MKERVSHTIEVTECGDKIPLSAELLAILDLPTEGVLRKKTDTEYYLFSEKSWHIFVQDMKKEKGMSETQYEYTREGRSFIKHLYMRAGTVDLKNKKIYFSSHTKEKILQEKNFIIRVYR